MDKMKKLGVNIEWNYMAPTTDSDLNKQRIMRQIVDINKVYLLVGYEAKSSDVNPL